MIRKADYKKNKVIEGDRGLPVDDLNKHAEAVRKKAQQEIAKAKQEDKKKKGK